MQILICLTFFWGRGCIAFFSFSKRHNSLPSGGKKKANKCWPIHCFYSVDFIKLTMHKSYYFKPSSRTYTQSKILSRLIYAIDYSFYTFSGWDKTQVPLGGASLGNASFFRDAHALQESFLLVSQLFPHKSRRCI